jgi:hypothetical protein
VGLVAALQAAGHLREKRAGVPPSERP